MNIIDADGHIVEKDSELRKYLPEPHSKRMGSLRPSDGLAARGKRAHERESDSNYFARAL